MVEVLAITAPDADGDALPVSEGALGIGPKS